jgi:transketolase
VSLIHEAGVRLSAEGLKVRLVSFPSWELFREQDADYQEKVLPANIAVRLAVEAGVSQGWERWTGSQGAILSVERFGASAPYQTIYEQYGLTVCSVVDMAHTLLAGKQK